MCFHVETHASKLQGSDIPKESSQLGRDFQSRYSPGPSLSQENERDCVQKALWQSLKQYTDQETALSSHLQCCVCVCALQLLTTLFVQ